MGSPSYQAPAVDTTPVEDDKKKAKKLRSALVATEGGIEGQEAQIGDVKQRDTLFGN